MPQHTDPHIPNYRELLCQEPNLCLKLLPRVDRIEKDSAMQWDKINAVTTRVDILTTSIAERDKSSGKIFAVMLALLALCALHFCAFLVWVGRTSERLDVMRENDKIQSEAIYKIEHQQKP